MVQPVNIRTMRLAARNAAQHIQDEKIQISRVTITRQQYAERWPDDYNSFVGSESRNNLYRDPDRFFRVMKAKPQFYNRRFIFRSRTRSGEALRQATIDAFEMIVRKAKEYGTQTGAYASSFIIDLDKRPLQGVGQLRNVNDDSVVRIYNTAPYAGTVEKNALYFANIGGVIYYAAKMMRKRYPQLGVNFNYHPAHRMPGTVSYYQVPVLTMGNPDNVISRLKTPGKNYRRQRRRRRTSRG